jgi:UDP-N-acetylglucosamine 2-epimerase (non-hydrolysing)
LKAVKGFKPGRGTVTKKTKLLIIAGARPNFMKVAPLIKQIRARGRDLQANGMSLVYRLVHTGQHYDKKMSGIFFDELGIPAPDINLEVGSGSHAVQTANVMTRFEPVCVQERPDWVVVVGDVNSSMACTLVAAKLGIRVAHVEAGLRSFDRAMPEEINRVVTDALADLLLTPSEDANENLRHEGVPEQRIRLVGNVMIDTLVENLARAREEGRLLRFGLKDKPFVYVTLHRPSNVDNAESLTQIMAELVRLSRHLPVVFPIHPRTRKMVWEYGIEMDTANGLKFLDPVGYHDSLCLTERARFVLTDSGGLQEESTYFRTPCLTLRPNTERPITVQMGSNRLTSLPQLRGDIERVLRAEQRIGRVPPLWDGHAAKRTLQQILATAGL